MESLYILLFSLFFSKISDKETDYFIPVEFEYPSSKIGQGKTFMYYNISTKKQRFDDLKLVNTNGLTYRSLKGYNSTTVSDSAIIRNGKSIEIYNFFISNDGTIAKAEVLQDTILYTGKKLGKHIKKISYSTMYRVEMSSEEQYLKDTSIIWQNVSVPVLVVQSSTIMVISEKFDGFNNFKDTTNVYSLLYYGKGLGLLRYSIYFIDHKGNLNDDVWELGKIINLRNLSSNKTAHNIGLPQYGLRYKS